MTRKRFILLSIVFSLLSSQTQAVDTIQQKIDYSVYEEGAPVEMVIQNSHNNDVNAICITPDGQYYVSGSKDKTIKIWTKDGKLIRTLSGMTYAVRYITITPDGKKIIASFESHNIMKMWRIDGKELKTFYDHKSQVNEIAVFPDGKHFISVSNDKSIKIWTIDGKLVKDIGEQPQYVKTVAISKDGLHFITGSVDKTMNVWSADGTLLKTIKGHKYSISKIRFTPDGKFFVTTDADNSIRFWNLDGSMHHTLNLKSIVYGVTLSPNGKWIAATLKDMDGIVFFDYKGEKIKTINNEKTSTYAFSPDSTYLIAGSWVGALDGHASAGTTIRQWDIEQNTFKEFRGASPTVFDLYITKDKQKIISMSSEGTGDGTVTIRNVNGTIETRIITKDRPIERMLVSKDEKYIITLSRRKHIGVWEDHKVNIWSIDGKMVREFKSTREVEYTLAAGLNHQYIVASSKATIDFLDFNGKKINSVPGKIKGIKTHIELSPDGKIIATNDYKINGTIFLKSMDGTFEKELKGHKWKVYKFQFSPDGSYIVTTSANSPNVWVWDLQGNSIQTIKHGLGFHIKSLAISSDSKMIATGGDDNNISLWSRTGEFLKYLPGHTNEVYSLTFSDEPSHLISGSMDGTVRVWNIANRQHYTMLADGNEWMIFDSQGNFDTSTNGGKLVAMVKGMSFWGVDQFALKNNRPDLILETVEMGAKPEIQNYYQQYKKRLRKAGITEQELFKEFHIPSVTILKTQVKGKNATIDFQMNDTKFDLKNYTVFVNDVPLFGAYGKKVNGKKIDLIENIELTNGKNKIEISCLNEKGAESYRAITYAEYRKPTKGNLYFIGFGVSIYQDRNLNLKYADKDVKDLASVFSKMKGKQFNQVQIRTFLNEKVTDESIKQAKTVLKNATPDDTLVLFIAGHGVHDQDRDATYYYLPHQADINNLSNTGISFESIEDILQGIPPRNKLFLMDTCESGEVEDSVQNHYFSIASSRGIKARTTRAIKLVNKKNNPAIQSRHFLYQKDRYIFNDLIRRSGTIVFSSSKGGEFSYESEKIENGYFTEEIIKGLQGRADRNSDKLVTSDELRDYVEKIVPKHTQNLQHPTVDRDNIFQKIEFPIVGQ